VAQAHAKAPVLVLPAERSSSSCEEQPASQQHDQSGRLACLELELVALDVWVLVSVEQLVLW
jgi:hypothetical protein